MVKFVSKNGVKGFKASNNRVFASKEYAEQYQKVLDKQQKLWEAYNHERDKLIEEEFKFLKPPEYLGYDMR